jgi:uncharacterized membrane protein
VTTTTSNRTAYCLLPTAYYWIAVFALAGITLILLYPDAEQQDAGFHFLISRWAWQNPSSFVSVWGRPLFTLLYYLPSQLGYPAAKLFTLVISLATAWQTFRLAEQLKYPRAALAIPLLFLQPSYFQISSEVMTEPLFALLLVIAYRLHLSGRSGLGALTASLLILVRPEGFFIGIFWGLLLLLDKRDERGGHKRGWMRRIAETAIMASGIAAWWLAAFLITRDPLWIAHDWPSNWHQSSSNDYTTGPIWWYLAQLPLISGPLLLVPFIAGLFRSRMGRESLILAASFLTLFITHSLMYWRGWFGSAGYARYFVCVSPVIALITLAGWNKLSERRPKIFESSWGTAGILGLSALVCLFYIDGLPSGRDAWAIEAMSESLRAYNLEVSRLICSQAYMRIKLDRDPRENPIFDGDRDHNLDLVRNSPGKTLIFWEELTGPRWFKLKEEDFESAGYIRLKSQTFRLEGRFFRLPFKRFGGTRIQQMHLLYKE